MWTRFPCRIYLMSEDPDGLKGVNQEKMAKAQQKKYPIIKGYRDQIENKYQWCIAAVPGEKWAKKLFPGLRREASAIEKLWEAILAHLPRVTEDPIAAWQAHNARTCTTALRRTSIQLRHQRRFTIKPPTARISTVGMIPEAQILRRRGIHACGGSCL